MITSFIPIIAAPINSRLYTPEEYGVWGSITALSALMGVLAYRHFPQILFLEKKESEVEAIFKQAIQFVILFSLMIFCILTPIVLYLQYDQNKYPNSFEVLQQYLSKLDCEKEIFIIDNKDDVKKDDNLIISVDKFNRKVVNRKDPNNIRIGQG